MLPLLVLGFLVACSSAEDARAPRRGVAVTDDLAIELRVDRPRVGPAEAIPAHVTIRNAGTGPRRLNRRLVVGYRDIIDRDVYFEITSARGPFLGTDQFETSVRAEDLEPRHFTTLAPGQELGRDVDLNEYYRLPRGTYQVVAVYAPQASPVAPDAWKGEARSAPVTIEIR